MTDAQLRALLLDCLKLWEVTGKVTVALNSGQVPITAGGTGAATAAAALTNLGAQAAIPGLASDGANGITVAGAVTAASLSVKNLASIGPRYDVTQFGAVGNGSTDDTAERLKPWSETRSGQKFSILRMLVIT